MRFSITSNNPPPTSDVARRIAETPPIEGAFAPTDALAIVPYSKQGSEHAGQLYAIAAAVALKKSSIALALDQPLQLIFADLVLIARAKQRMPGVLDHPHFDLDWLCFCLQRAGLTVANIRVSPMSGTLEFYEIICAPWWKRWLRRWTLRW